MVAFFLLCHLLETCAAVAMMSHTTMPQTKKLTGMLFHNSNLDSSPPSQPITRRIAALGCAGSIGNIHPSISVRRGTFLEF
jgi:hypothetical protein